MNDTATTFDTETCFFCKAPSFYSLHLFEEESIQGAMNVINDWKAILKVIDLESKKITLCINCLPIYQGLNTGDQDNLIDEITDPDILLNMSRVGEYRRLGYDFIIKEVNKREKQLRSKQV